MNLRLFSLFLMFGLLTGCGMKGPVQPLQKPLPAAPPEIALAQKGDRLLLSWHIPEKNQDGSALTDLARFRIYRMEYDPADECPECRDTSTLRREVDLEYLLDVTRRGSRLYFWDEAVKTGRGYIYRIAPVTEKGREGASAVARRPVVAPPRPPSELAAQGLDKLVRLNWDESPVSAAEVEILGYNVYRAIGDRPFVGSPLNSKILVRPEYEDFGLENGQTYRYAVRTVASKENATVESAFSEIVKVVPRAGR
ncbi:MAG TPA: fibronectin type III domain-containing protein [Desulfuromonadales bacterium]|nr:fibronectin type III domain-containing protein [Desulfuromonadales bacterium]